MEQRVVDRDQYRCARLGQPLDDQHRDPQPELINRPARVTEEAMRARVMPNPRQPRADEASP
jgi:hypothetical protein